MAGSSNKQGKNEGPRSADVEPHWWAAIAESKQEEIVAGDGRSFRTQDSEWVSHFYRSDLLINNRNSDDWLKNAVKITEELVKSGFDA